MDTRRRGPCQRERRACAVRQLAVAEHNAPGQVLVDQRQSPSARLGDSDGLATAQARSRRANLLDAERAQLDNIVSRLCLLAALRIETILRRPAVRLQ